jgi:predicted GNAT superfamily acetyltransferase
MIEIRKIVAIEDYQKLPAIQQSAWGFGDLDTETYHLMTRVQKYGGLLLGLYRLGLLIGFSYAIIGRREGEYFLYSHMTAIQREYAGQGFGLLLKKAQRDEALAMGYAIIRWTFDPLETLNLHFNLRRLGAVSREYERNIYGVGESGLHAGMTTDRLVACWHLDSERVSRRLEEHPPRLIETVDPGKAGEFDQACAYIEVPRDIRAVKMADMSAARAWRQRTREEFETAFSGGYQAEEIVFSENDDRAFIKLWRRP